MRIIGYSYSNSTEVLTPKTGIPAWPVGSDYTASTIGNFTYQVELTVSYGFHMLSTISFVVMVVVCHDM